MHIKKWFQMLCSMYYCTGVLKYNLQVSFWRTHRYAVPSPRDFFRLVEACEIVGCTVSNFKELIYLKKIILRRLIVTCFTDSCCFFFFKSSASPRSQPSWETDQEEIDQERAFPDLQTSTFTCSYAPQPQPPFKPVAPRHTARLHLFPSLQFLSRMFVLFTVGTEGWLHPIPQFMVYFHDLYLKSPYLSFFLSSYPQPITLLFPLLIKQPFSSV